MRPALYAFVVAAYVWGWYSLGSGASFLTQIKLFAAVPMWGYALITLTDMVAAWRGVNSEYVRRFYESISDDLMVALVTGAASTVIYMLSGAAYSSASFDLLVAAIPFAASTILTVRRIGQARIGSRSIKTRSIRRVIATLVFAFGYVLFLGIGVASGRYTLLASTWLQITIVFASLYGFIETRRVLYVLTVKRMEVSPITRCFFRSDGQYAALEKASELWNNEVAAAEAAGMTNDR